MTKFTKISMNCHGSNAALRVASRPVSQQETTLGRYYTKKTSVPLYPWETMLVVHQLGLPGNFPDFHCSKPAGPATAGATTAFRVCRTFYISPVCQRLYRFPFRYVSLSLNRQMPCDDWAGPSCSSPVTTPQFKFGAALLFAPDRSFVSHAIILCIAVLHNV